MLLCCFIFMLIIAVSCSCLTFAVLFVFTCFLCSLVLLTGAHLSMGAVPIAGG